jgi:hypothetical protein
MVPLDFSTEPLFECVDDDSGDLAFVWTMGLIGGWDVVEEYLAYKMFPLLANFGFAEIADGETPMSKVTLPLPEFSITKLQGESNDHFLVMVEIRVENVVGSYGHVEHDSYLKALSNEGQLN